MAKRDTQSNLISRWYPPILTIGGLSGLVAMTWQMAERVHMLKSPAASLSCNLNPIIDCGTVLNHRLAALFGFPNALLGIVFFAILFTSGLLLLAGGAFNKWFRHFVAVVSLMLLLFSLWFFGVSLYVIGKVCIFCVVGWVVSIPIFWYGLLHYWQTAPAKLGQTQRRFMDFGHKYHLSVVLAMYAVMLILYLLSFRSYYFG